MLLEMDIAAIDKAVVLPIDATTSRNATIFTNEQIVEVCRMSDRLIGSQCRSSPGSAPETLTYAMRSSAYVGLN